MSAPDRRQTERRVTVTNPGFLSQSPLRRIGAERRISPAIGEFAIGESARLHDALKQVTRAYDNAVAQCREHMRELRNLLAINTELTALLEECAADGMVPSKAAIESIIGRSHEFI